MTELEAKLLAAEELRLELEKQRVALEAKRVEIESDKLRGARDSSRGDLLKTVLPALLAFLTSIASLFIAYRSNEDARRSEAQRAVMQQREAMQREAMQQRASEERRAEEGRKLAMEHESARYRDARADNQSRELAIRTILREYKSAVTGRNTERKRELAQILLVEFDASTVGRVLERLHAVHPDPVWQEALQTAKRLQEREE